jgi:hypothetical protein
MVPAALGILIFFFLSFELDFVDRTATRRKDIYCSFNPGRINGIVDKQ